MARTYKRDARGRFAGGGGGGKMGKSSSSAKAAYKAASSNVRAANREHNSGRVSENSIKTRAGALRQKEALTKAFRGGKTGNIGRTKADQKAAERRQFAEGMGKVRQGIASRRAASKASAKPTAAATKTKAAAAKPKSKSAQTRAANAARNQELRDKGLRGSGSRIQGKLKGFSGTAATQKKQKSAWRSSNAQNDQLQFAGRSVKGTIKRKKRG